MGRPIKIFLALLCVALLFLSPSLGASADFEPAPAEQVETVVLPCSQVPLSLRGA